MESCLHVCANTKFIREMTSNNHYRTLIFPTVVLLTLLSGATSIVLSAQPNLTEQQRRVLENSSNTWLMGTGTIFGLLGGCTGSALNRYLDRSDSQPEEDK